MAEDENGLAREIFVVNNEPYCVFGWDLHQRNTDFLDGFDTVYFEFLLNTLLEAKDDKRAAVAIRSTYHHSLETLFTFLGALAQAPSCTYAWIARCSTQDLRAIIERIQRGEQVDGPWVNRPSGWSGLADIVFAYYLPGTDKGHSTKALFATLWSRLACEFLDGDNVAEYNSIKHGLRMRAGGFTLRAGTEHSYGVPPPEEEMSTIGQSEHGSSFFRLERVEGKDSRAYTTRRLSLNWRIERVILLCQLTITSIQNVVGALRCLNGAAAGTVRFFRPPDDADFDRPWSYTTGVTRMDMDFVYPPGMLPPLKKSDLLDEIAHLRTRKKTDQN